MSAQLTYLVYSLLWKTVRIMPEKIANAFFNRIAELAYRRNKKRVQRLRENYRQVRPKASHDEIESMVKSGLISAMRYWCDTFRISDWDKKRIIETVTCSNEELLLTGAASGKGVIVALPHAGNWDHAGLYFCMKGITVHTVAEHLKPEKLFMKFLEHREKMGMKVFDIDGSVIQELEEILRRGGLVALVADRDLSKSGITVDFFDGFAKMPAGPALLALRTGASLITAFVAYTKTGIHINFAGPFNLDSAESGKSESGKVIALTQKLADQFSRDITKDPTSWHMQQRIFLKPEAVI
ncbi:MAG: phosphatidylinositol mannoside acyltransferase [Candidatus Nanopelagicaceae bacterium]